MPAAEPRNKHSPAPVGCLRRSRVPLGATSYAQGTELPVQPAEGLGYQGRGELRDQPTGGGRSRDGA